MLTSRVIFWAYLLAVLCRRFFLRISALKALKWVTEDVFEEANQKLALTIATTRHHFENYQRIKRKN
jgi:hypothetical protein